MQKNNSLLHLEKIKVAKAKITLAGLKEMFPTVTDKVGHLIEGIKHYIEG